MPLPAPILCAPGAADTLAPMSAASTTAVARPLTERSAVELAAAIRSGELRARDVVEAHIEVIELSLIHI